MNRPSSSDPDRTHADRAFGDFLLPTLEVFLAAAGLVAGFCLCLLLDFLGVVFAAGLPLCCYHRSARACYRRRVRSRLRRVRSSNSSCRLFPPPPSFRRLQCSSSGGWAGLRCGAPTGPCMGFPRRSRPPS